MIVFFYMLPSLLTPSFVQIQLVHGDGNADWPTATWRPPI